MLFRVVLALLASLCFACGGEPEFDAHVRIAANGVAEFECHTWSPPRPGTGPDISEFWSALWGRARERRRPAYPGAPADQTFSACRLRVTIDPEVRMGSAFGVLYRSDWARWSETTLCCADPAVPTLKFTSSTELGMSCMLQRGSTSSITVGVSLGEGDLVWWLSEQPDDEQAVSLAEVDWERARAVVASRRPHGGRLNLWVRVPPTMSWREFAPHLQRALELQPEWMEFGH